MNIYIPDKSRVAKALLILKDKYYMKSVDVLAYQIFEAWLQERRKETWDKAKEANNGKGD